MEPRTVSRCLLVACWMAIVARLLLVAVLIAIVLTFVYFEAGQLLYLVSLAALVAVWGTYFLLALALRCPDCRRRILVESRHPKHPNARKEEHFGHWGTLVWAVVRRRDFTCMHCGTPCRVS